MNGFKKYSPIVNTPEYPKITHPPIRFVDSRKNWKVDVGETLKTSEMYPMFVDGIVPFQSRDRNETTYGKSSHRDYVNEYVRYPLITPYDLLPESRKPRRIVFPRTNPGPGGNDSNNYQMILDPGWDNNTFTGMREQFIRNRITRNF